MTLRARTTIGVAVAAAVLLAVLLLRFLLGAGGPGDSGPFRRDLPPDPGAGPAPGSAAAGDPASTSPRSGVPEDEDGLVRGRVVDADGRPVPGACLRLGDASTTSGPDGGFSLRAPPFSASGSAGTLLASKEGYGTAQVPLRRSSPREIRVMLLPAAEVSGEVTSAGGPVTGARVLLEDGEWRRLVVTAADGRFRFPEAGTQRCEVLVAADGYGPASMQIGPGVSARRIRIRLEPADDLPVRVVDEVGTPVEGAEVTVTWNWSSLRARGTSDGNGLAMRLPRSDSRASLHVVAPGFAPGGGALSCFAGPEFTVVLRREVVLEVHALGTGGPEEWRSWSVALGSNRWQDPHAVSPPPGPEYGSSPPIGEVHGDPWVGFDHEGKALLHGVQEGFAYTIVAVRREDGGSERSHRTIVWRTGSLPAGMRVIEWTPPRLTPVRIATRVSGTREGVSAKVLVRMDAGTLAAHEEEMPSSGRRFPEGITTDAAGKGTAWLWPGRYTFTAYGGVGTSGDVFASSELTVGESEAAVEVLLPPIHVVSGSLRTSDGRPLPRRNVSLWGKGQEPIHYFVAVTDDTGAFEIRGVPAGTYDLQWDGARGEGLFNGPRSIAVPTGPLELAVSLCTVRGDVRPLPRSPAVVALRPPRTGEWIVEPLDDTGAFEVPGLSPGEWIVEVRKPTGEVLRNQTVSIADGTVLNIVLE